jgi:hypothetical protein
MESHLSLDHVHHLIARVHVKFAAVFAAARDKDQRIGLLPQNTYLVAAFHELASVIEQANDWHL